MHGTIHNNYARKNYPNAEIFQYHSIPDMIMALYSGKVDVAMIGNVTLKDILKRNNKIGVLENEIYSFPLGCGLGKEDAVLRNQFNFSEGDKIQRELRRYGEPLDEIRDLRNAANRNFRQKWNTYGWSS